MNNKQKIFQTRDLYLATTFLCLSFELENIDYQLENIDYQVEGGENERLVGYFCFKEDENLKTAEKQYWAGKLAVEPRTFVNNLRALRAQIATMYKSPTIDFANFKRKEE